MKPRIFIASPLFNPLQIAIIASIEALCEKHGYEYYSARKDSEPFVPKGDDKKKHAAWYPVFNNNIEGLDQCNLMIAVMEYALPPNQGFGLGDGEMFKPLELPDTGTVWEAGYFRGQHKPVIGYHSSKDSSNINLMLSHGCDGLISGLENLTTFFETPEAAPNEEPEELLPRELLARLHNPGSLVRVYDLMTGLLEWSDMLAQFNWGVCHTWDAVQKETL